MDIIKAVNETGMYIDKKAPLILLGSGIVLGTCTVGLGCAASFKASDIVKDIRDNPLQYGTSKKSIALAFAKKVVPLYIPVAIVGAGSVVCLVKSYDISTKRLAAATALAEVSIETFRLYKEQTRKLLGKEKEQEISEAVRKEKIFKPDKDEEGQLVTKSNVHPFIDSITNQSFFSTMDAVKEAELELNLRLHSEMYISIDEFMDILNDVCCMSIGGERTLQHQEYFGNQNGWREGYPIRFSYVDSHLTDGTPATKITYNLPPIMDYRERYF